MGVLSLCYAWLSVYEPPGVDIQVGLIVSGGECFVFECNDSKNDLPGCVEEWLGD